MEFVIPHQATYEFEGRASVPEIAKSLLAQDKLFRDAILVLEQCFPNLKVESVRIDIREVTQSSPFRTFMTASVLAVYASELGEDMPDILDTLFGVNVPDTYDSWVSVIILLIAIYGIDRLRSKLFPADGDRALDAEKERLLTAAADQASVTKGTMREAVETVVGKRPGTVGRAALDFLAPAKRHKARSIKTGRELISEQAIEAVPSDLDLAQYEPASKVEPLEGAIVKFRAHDLDKGKNWAATIEDVSPDRRPLHLAPDISVEPLFGKRAVKADVLVTSIRDLDGDYVPSLYYMTRVYDEPTPSPRAT